MMDSRNVAALALVVLFAGCASRSTLPGGVTEETFSALPSQMEKNSSHISAAETRIAELQKRVTALEALVTTMAADSMRLREMTENVSFLSGEVLRLDAALQGSPVKTQLSDTTGVFKPDGFAVEPAYQAALTEYRAGKYESAIGRFTEIIAVAPASTLADNAQYWIGESWFALKDYARALDAFKKVFTFPDTNKDADASLKIAIIHSLTGDREMAKSELKAVIGKYPGTETAKAASEALAEMEKE